MEENTRNKSPGVILKKIFPILDDSYTIFQIDDKKFNETEFYEASKTIKSIQPKNLVQKLIVSKIEQRLRNEIVPEFWSYFRKSESDNNTGFKQFYNAIKTLYDCYIKLYDTLENLKMFVENTDEIYHEKDHFVALIFIVKASLLSSLPLDYQNTITNFYESVLKMDAYKEPDDKCCICLQDCKVCNCLHLFNETNRKLRNMDLLEPLVGQILTNITYSFIDNRIYQVCKDCFDVHFKAQLKHWFDNTVISWLKKIYQCDSSNDETITRFYQKILTYISNSYVKLRIEQLFNIIIEYPESLPALEDLHEMLPQTYLKPVLSQKLQKSMETRLLHPGVSTPDILTAYIAAIRSLRVLDPTGLLLETVTQPVHQYLRSREDTVRCVVSSLTEEGPNDLAEELIRGEAVQVDENTPVDEEDGNWEEWVPDPVDAVPIKTISSRRTSDIITMLVNVYGSKELFVNEYRTLLADRLLSQYTCDTEKEIRYLELLKLRFGDSQLHYCEVMLKDIADSKRINQHIKQDSNYNETDIPMSALIVSAQFWPAFKEEKLQLHSKLVQQMEIYTSAFETLKGSRTLSWKNHLGFVDLEIALSDRVLNLSVTPIQATIMMYFQDKSTWELEELSKVMQCPPTILRRKIMFWQSHGIITEMQTDVYCIQEDVENKAENAQEDIYIEDFEAESAMASAQDQREEELQTFWSYIVGMLMNLDTLPLERIHQMLKMFAFQGPTIECSMQELKVFLDRKVREHQLIYSNGFYKLPK